MGTEGSTLWEKVAGNLQEWYTEAMGWTGEKARIGVKRMEMVGIQHNIKRSMTHLGGRVYDLIQRGVDVPSDEQVQMIMGNLRRLEEELAAHEREIDALRARRGGEEAREQPEGLSQEQTPVGPPPVGSEDNAGPGTPSA